MFQFWLDREGYTRDLANLGEKGSYVMIFGESFCHAAVAPLSYYKFFNGEGGMRVPLILATPEEVSTDRSNAFTFVTDLVPTILELAGAEPIAQAQESLCCRSL